MTELKAKPLYVTIAGEVFDTTGPPFTPKDFLEIYLTS
jgi:hypothetical protein